jgi:O-antigen/teichoic acid export membrane protein
MSVRARAARGALWGAVERAASQGISFVVVLVLARLLGPESYGLAALAATCVLLGQMLLGETFSESLVQAARLEQQHLTSVFWMLLCAAMIVAGAFYLGADALAGALGQPAVAPILRALSPLPVVSAAQSVPVALFRRELDYRALALASTVGALCGGVTGIAAALAGLGVWSFVVNLATQSVATAVVIWVKTEFRPRGGFSRRHLASLWSYGQYTFVLRVAAYAANQSPRLLIGYFFGPVVLGHFSLALRFVETMHQFLAVPAMNVLLPVVARYRADPVRLRNGIVEATQLCAMIVVPAFTALALIAPVGLPLLFGAQWRDSAVIVQIFAAFGVVGAGGLLWRGIIAGLGRPVINLVTTLCAAALGVGLIVAVAPLGPVAAAAVFIVRGYATLPALPFVIRRLTGVSAGDQYRAFVPVLAASAIMALVTIAFEAAAARRLDEVTLAITTMAVCAASYAAALYVVARPTLRLGVSVLGVVRARQEAV